MISPESSHDSTSGKVRRVLVDMTSYHTFVDLYAAQLVGSIQHTVLANYLRWSSMWNPKGYQEVGKRGYRPTSLRVGRLLLNSLTTLSTNILLLCDYKVRRQCAGVSS